MGEFEIACRKVAGWAEKIDGCSKDIKKQESHVADVMHKMRVRGAQTYGVEQALTGISENLHRQHEQMKQYGDLLESIARTYEGTEADVLETGALKNGQ